MLLTLGIYIKSFMQKIGKFHEDSFHLHRDGSYFVSLTQLALHCVDVALLVSALGHLRTFIKMRTRE
jgi:hypothetical protein